MNIEDFRTYYLSFKGAYEKMPFEKAASAYDRNLLVFCVAEKWFCFVNVETFDFCNIKCAPDWIVDLQERYEGVTPAYHMNKKHWISVHFDKDVPDRTIEDLVKQSYDLVAASLPKRRERLCRSRKRHQGTASGIYTATEVFSSVFFTPRREPEGLLRHR